MNRNMMDLGLPVPAKESEVVKIVAEGESKSVERGGECEDRYKRTMHRGELCVAPTVGDLAHQHSQFLHRGRRGERERERSGETLEVVGRALTQR